MRWQFVIACAVPLSAWAVLAAWQGYEYLHEQRSAGNALVIAAVSGAAMVCVAIVWLTMMRRIRARARAEVLASEARRRRELNQAAAGLAHRTRDPLSLVRSGTQRLIQSEVRSPEGRQQAQALIEGCDRVAWRINQFLAFAGPCQPVLAAVRPAEVLEELATLLEPDLEAKQLTLGRHLSRPNDVVQADPRMFRQVLFNLLHNAIQFSPQRQTVRVNVRRGSGGTCRIEVSDRGPGVAAEAAPSLFSPYFTTRADGTGLGLAIVRQIAAAHGWEAGYCPRNGGGAIFYLDRIRV